MRLVNRSTAGSGGDAAGGGGLTNTGRCVRDLRLFQSTRVTVFPADSNARYVPVYFANLYCTGRGNQIVTVLAVSPARLDNSGAVVFNMPTAELLRPPSKCDSVVGARRGLCGKRSDFGSLGFGKRSDY